MSRRFEHCTRFADEYPGKAVSVMPELRDVLVILSRDYHTWVSVFECSVCGQPWEEAYEATGHGERPMVRKLSAVEADE